uniref:hypothetical protein n=1 Tax=Nocardia sp. TaxID=1821 RepID=UPI002586D4C3
ALAARVATLAASARPKLVAKPRPGKVPLSLAQQRMWFLNQFDTASATGTYTVMTSWPPNF